MMNVHAIHTGTCNWEEYVISLREMMPGLSSATRPTTHVRYHIGSTQQDGYDSDSAVNSGSESEAASKPDFDTESESLESLDEP